MKIPKRRIDWFYVVSSLSRYGFSIKHTASAICVPASTVHGWKMGAEPKHTEGEKLIEFWCQVTGRQRAEIPSVLD